MEIQSAFPRWECHIAIIESPRVTNTHLSQGLFQSRPASAGGECFSPALRIGSEEAQTSRLHTGAADSL
jgi:hypothetical protein